jgi:hypothetical protein
MLARIPGASADVTLSPGATWAIYAVLFGVTAFFTLSLEQREALLRGVRRQFGLKTLAAGGLLVGALCWAAWTRLPDGDLHITFGEHMALITTPHGDHILVNGGASSRRLRTALGDTLPFWKRRIDVLVITRPESAATRAVMGALERHSVGVVLVGDFERTEELENLLLELELAGTPIVVAQEGTTITVADGVRMTVMEAHEAIALMMVYDEATVLITSGLSPEDWPAMPPAVIQEGASIDDAFEGPQVVLFDYGRGETLVYSLEGSQTVHISTDGERVWAWNP